MQQAMAVWGPDGSDLWHAGPCGLGHMRLNNTPESFHERLPEVDDETGCVLTAAARIDNRDELCDRLRIPAGERGRLPDDRLILLAYRRWGENHPNGL